MPEHIIIRFLQDAAGEDEMQILDEWLSHGRNMEMFWQFVEIWDSGKSMPEKEIGQRWDKFYREVVRDTVVSPTSTVKRQIAPEKKPRTGQWVRYAAAILIGAVVASALWLGLQRQEKDTPVQQVAYNQNGVQKIMLPDSSVAWLSGNSRMTYPERFDGRVRKVALEGEAFFEVRKAPSHPFEVQAGNADVRVTGTEFVVRHFPESDVTVTLVSGGVTVNARDHAGKPAGRVQLVPGQQASVGRLSGQIGVNESDTDYYVAWKDGTYRFRNEPLERIAALLERKYNVTIHITPGLKDRHFTGRITPKHNISDVMEIISVSNPVKYRITKTDVYISEK